MSILSDEFIDRADNSEERVGGTYGGTLSFFYGTSWGIWGMSYAFPKLPLKVMLQFDSIPTIAKNYLERLKNKDP